MKTSTKNPFVLMLFSLLMGVFVTVSFLETPLKFQVPGITLPVALELGKLMFGISTQIQCVFLLLIVGIMVFNRKSFKKIDFIVIGALFFLIIIQKFWMLPVLDARADLLSLGKPVSPSELHNYFIYSEVAKTILLIIAIVFQFKIKKTNN